MTTFGEIAWSDDISDRKSTNSKDLFLRLDDGSNEMRLVTQPFQYTVHKVKKDPNDKKDYGQKVSCSKVHGKCQVCDSGDEPKARWFLGVISRKTNTYKILDISWAVYSQIKKLAQAPRWGNPAAYDIDIIVDRKGGATGYYTVQPLGKEALSAEDQLIRDNVDFEDLRRRVTPFTPEQVQKRLDKIMGVEGATLSGSTPSVPVATASRRQSPSVSTASANTADDEDGEFPAYN